MKQSAAIPAYSLYGENSEFPDVLHCEPIMDRAHLHGWKIAPHRHFNLNQIFLMISGEASMTLDGSTLTLPAETVVIVPPHSVHGFEFEQNTVGFVLSLPATEVKALSDLDKHLSATLSKARTLQATSKIRGVFRQIYQEHMEAGIARIPLLRGLTIQLVSYLAQGSDGVRSVAASGHHIIAEFEALARAHLSQGWRVSDYAFALKTSTTHLNRMCKARLGQSPQAYIHTLLMQEAKRLLAYTQLDIASIGYRLGFDDPAYFSRVFRRQTGQSPRQFRGIFTAP